VWMVVRIRANLAARKPHSCAPSHNSEAFWKRPPSRRGQRSRIFCGECTGRECGASLGAFAREITGHAGHAGPLKMGRFAKFSV
jgi:hypothetical protein